MNKLKMETTNITKENIQKIEDIFPNVIVETAKGREIDFDLLKQELSNSIVEGNKEKYQLTWPGQKEAILTANTSSTNTLRPIKEKSVNFENTKNIYIEGDNLEVLKILQESYLNKIKCIYIDPPYNTGSDLIYNDSFEKDTKDELILSGQMDNEGNKLVSNTQSNGRFHSDWLSMMYSRLKLARNLLTKDGVIFISIDDNEYTNLIKLSEMIFGPNNVETLIWNKEAEGSSGTLKQTLRFRRIHEYIVICYKNKDQVLFGKIHEALKGKENELQTANLAVNADVEKEVHPNRFDIVNPNGVVFNRQWKFSKSEIDRLIKEDLIYWGSDGNKQPRLIIPTDHRRTVYLQSIINKGGTTVGRKDFEKLMGNIEFSYPKPICVISDLLQVTTDKNSIILDFFSGSGTTAQTVMQLNAEDNGNRKFIMVQLPEKYDETTEAYKKGYKNICEVGEERIRRAAKKIKEETDVDIDYGFRVFKVDSSNMKDIYYKPNELLQEQLNLFETNIKEDRTADDLLTQIILDLGLTLDMNIKEKNILDNKVYYVEDNCLVACLDNNINIEILDEMCKCNPLRIVFKESAFKYDNDKINLQERIRKISPDTDVSIL